MNELDRPLSPHATPFALARAIEGNTIGYYRNFGRAPGAELHEEPGLVWLRTGIQDEMFNGVLQAQLQPESAAPAIARVVEYFNRARLPITWHTGPSTRPLDLGRQLLAHGFQLADEEPGMAADLSAIDEAFQAPPGLTVETVAGEETLREWLRVWIRPVPEAAELLQACFEVYSALVLAERAPLKFYLGRLRDRPAGIAALWVSAGVASVQHVVTIPEARRQGIGAAMTLAVLREARARGYLVAVLTASAMGQGIYRRIGFREYCRMHTYRRHPQ